MTNEPEPLDFSDNRERTNAYIIGLETRNKQLRLDNEELRDKIKNPELLDARIEARLRKAYQNGRKDALNNIASEIRDLQQALNSTGEAVWQSYLQGERESHAASEAGDG